MIRRLARLTTLSVIMVVFGAARAAQASVDDGHGKDWRQLTETIGLSWSQVPRSARRMARRRASARSAASTSPTGCGPPTPR